MTKAQYAGARRDLENPSAAKVGERDAEDRPTLSIERLFLGPKSGGSNFGAAMDDSP